MATDDQSLSLGAFSISLAVKDLAASRAFYEKLGFVASGGSEEHNYLILANGTTIIGIFQGMFEDDILTFNPGFGQDMKPETHFTDVREIADVLEARGIEVKRNIDKDAGPAHVTVTDPDGNTILIDQHV